MLTTTILQNRLAHCNGRKTVEYIDGTVYHYGTPILTLCGDNIVMHYAYDYSMSTSRVRNAALSILGYPEFPPTTKQLQQAEKNGEVIEFAGYLIVFEKWN